MDMKPISFAIGAKAARIDKVKPQTDPKNSGEANQIEPKPKSEIESNSREKLKTNEPNARLRKPDFSNGAIETPMAESDPIESVAQIGDDLPIETATTSSATKSKLEAATWPHAHQTIEAFILSQASATITVDPAPIAPDANVKAKFVKSEFAAMGALGNSRSDLAATVVPSHGLIDTNSIEQLGGGPSQDLVDPAMFFGAGPAQDLVDPKLLANLPIGPAQDFVDPKLLANLQGSPAQDLVDPKLLSNLANGQAQDFVDPKLLNNLPIGPAQDLADPKLLSSLASGPAQDFVDPKLLANLANGQAQDLIDRSTIKVQTSQISQDMVDPTQYDMYPTGGIKPSFAIANSIQLSVDGDEIATVKSFGPSQDFIDPKHWANMASGQAQDLIDPKLHQIKLQQAAQDLTTTLPNQPSQDWNLTFAQDLVDGKLTTPVVSADASEVDSNLSDVDLAGAFASDDVQAPSSMNTRSDLFGSNPDSKNDRKNSDDLFATDGMSSADDHFNAVAVDLSSRDRVANVKAKDTEPLTRAEAASILKQVADRLESLAAARPRHGVTIHLKPFDLGHITMTIKGSGSSVEAEIQASNESVRVALEQAQKHLSASLETKGYSLSNLTVSESSSAQSQTSHSDANSKSAQHQATANSGSSANSRLDDRTDLADQTNRNFVHTATQGVDYLI